MAPIRRTRQEFEADEVSTAHGPVAASSDAQSDSVKRVRTSLVHAESPLTTSTAGSIDRRGLSFREFYERRRDASQAPEHEISVDEIIAERDGLNQQPFNENRALECGILQSITCINFMCHNKLHVALGPNINFIIGHNGSGKSAVLTALQLCLGGKATVTNRGQSLKSFVKEGQETATLIVKIKNAGEGNYKPRIFGDTIVIERQFSISGASGFKIKNESGKIISTKRAQLDEICDWYALQLDNPVNVLTQDMARQFLNSSSSEEKYRFFVKGVQLEQLDTDYLILADNLTNTENKLFTIKEDNQHLAEASRVAQQKYALTRNFGKLNDSRQNLQGQATWIQVETEERRLDEAKQELLLARENLAKQEDLCETLNLSYNRADQDEENVRLAFEEKEKERQPLQEAVIEAEKEEQVAANDVKDFLASQRKMHSELASTSQSAEQHRLDVQEEFQKLQKANGEGEAAKLAEINLAEQRLQGIESTQGELQARFPDLERDQANASRHYEESEGPLKRAMKELSSAEERLNALKQGTSSGKAYPPALPQVERAIESEKRWRDRPVGPLGKHIRLKQGRWSSVLETTFGRVLESFVVSNQADQNLLTAIMRRTRYPGQVNNVRNGDIDTRGHEPEEGVDSILRVLDIENNLVRNSLIINQNIDQFILISDRQSLNDYMYKGQRPSNVKGGLCFSDDGSGRGLRFSYGRGGTAKSDPVAAWTRNIRIQTNMDEQLQMADATVQRLKSILQEAEARRTCLRGEELKSKQAVNRLRKEMKEYSVRYDREKLQLQELRHQLEDLMPQDGRLDGLKSLLAEDEANCRSLQAQIDESQVSRQRKQSVANEASAKRESIGLQLQDFNARLDTIRRKGEAARGKKTAARHAHEAALNELTNLQRAVASAERVCSRQQDQVTSFTGSAIEVFPNRVKVDRGMTYASLEKRLEDVEKRIKQYEEEIGGSEEEISRKAAETLTAWNRSEKNQRELQSILDKLTLSLDERRKRWIIFRANIASRARSHFFYLLSERGYVGSMVLDHRAKSLDLMIQPTGDSQESQQRQTKTLSGGEKSYTTICLLLSLWDAMGSPIRCLDEFDVFMDSVHRDASIKQMLQAARRSVGKQYIFITPQAMGSLQPSPDVKIIRLSDPERGQTALNFESVV